MHIRSVVVRNYRVHRELAISFDRKLTLIGGPNEVGKSTLAEAIHRGLFLKSKVTGEALTPMKSNVGDGVPEIEIEFQKNDDVYRVHKKFSGVNGTTRLSHVNGKTWQGEEAESRLAEILGVEQVGGGRGIGERVGQQWAHLWVWQGQSGTDPSTYATAQRDSLLSRLQSGAAIVMQSELDSRVAKLFTHMVDEEFSKKREPKVNSPLGQTRLEFSKAKDAVIRAEEQCRNLQNAAEDFRRAGQDLKEADTRLVVLRSDLSRLNEKLELVKDLGGRVKEKRALVDQDRQKIEALKSAGHQVDEAAQDLKKIQEQLHPARSIEVDLIKAEKEAIEDHTRANQAYEAARESENQAISKVELATAVENHLRVSSDLGTCLEDQKAAERIRQNLLDAETQLSALPAISEEQMQSLRNWSQKRGEAEATLSAIATGIELVTADQSIQVGQNELQAGSPVIITEVTEIRIGSGIRLLIRPGGGHGVTAAEQSLRNAEQEIRERLISIGVSTVSEAEAIFQDAQQLTQRINIHKSELRSVNADTLLERVERMQKEQTKYAAEIHRRKQLQNISLNLPETAADVAAFLAECQQERDKAAADVRQLKIAREGAEKLRNTAQSAFKEFRIEVTTLEDDEKSVNGRLSGLILAAGDAETRKRQIEELEQKKATSIVELAELESRLGKLEPDELSSQKTRLQRSLESQEDARRTAGERQAVAKSILQSQGVIDPHEQLAAAHAKMAEATERLENGERQANAKFLLADLFQAEQRKHSATFTLPLVTKISDYLRPVFGRAIDVQLSNDALKFSGFGLNRRDNQQGAVDFDSLSAGAREQLAAAMRLAMAELLAEGSDGCLPIVFDDAFAYSDPDRVEALQAMLDMAASRGLQIIVLTCSPRDYYRLGAREVILSPKNTSSGAGSSNATIQRAEDAPLLIESRQPDTSPRSASQFSRQSPEYQSPARHLGEIDPVHATSAIVGDDSVDSDETPPVVDRTEKQPVALRWGSDPAHGVEMPTESPTGAKPTDPTMSSGRDDPRAVRLLEKLQLLGGTAAKSALRLELGMSFGDFTSLLQDMLQKRLIREDRTKIKVSLAGD